MRIRVGIPMYAHNVSGVVSCVLIFGSQAAWKAGRSGNWGKDGRLLENGPRPENGRTIATKWNWGHYILPMSGHGPVSISVAVLTHFRLSARFPFCARPSDSQRLSHVIELGWWIRLVLAFFLMLSG